MVTLYTLRNFCLILAFTTTFTDAMNITAVRGSQVCLPCASDLYANGIITVTWKKTGSPGILCQYRVQNGTASDTIFCKHHIYKTQRPPMLCLTGIKTRDAGDYNCSMSRAIPPPTVEKFFKVKLHIEGSPLITIESQTSNKSDCLWLLCQLDGLDSTQLNLTWSRNGQRIPETNSSLHLCNHDWSEGDTFTCNYSHSSSYTGLSASITITQTHSRVDDSKANYLIIICVGVLIAATALICLVIYIYKCKKANSRGSTIVYTNKVYENFSFSTHHQQTQRNVTTHQEQCVYEN